MPEKVTRANRVSFPQVIVGDFQNDRLSLLAFNEDVGKDRLKRLNLKRMQRCLDCVSKSGTNYSKQSSNVCPVSKLSNGHGILHPA